MSYDLMVFDPDSAPRTRQDFMDWYKIQTQWSETHTYDDPSVSSENLRDWFLEMIISYPAMNGPYAKELDEEEDDDDYTTDYSIGKSVIYVAFAWSVAEEAYEKMKSIAEKHKVGFFDVSADEGDILFPDENGKSVQIDNPNNLSSILQIKNSASAGQESKSVQEIIYSKVLPQIMAETEASKRHDSKNKKKWWQKLFGSR